MANLFGLLGAPPQQAQTQAGAGPYERMMGSILAGGRARDAYSAQKDMLQEAQRRFASLGTEEARNFASQLASNPQAAVMWAEQNGGIGKLHAMMQAQAQSQQAGQVYARASSADPAIAEMLSQGMPFEFAQELAKTGAALDLDRARAVKARRPAKREIRADRNGVPRYVDTGEPLYPGTTNDAKPLTPSQEANALETMDARKQLINLMAEQGWEPGADMRRLISKGSNPFDFNFDDESQDRYAAQLWQQAKQRIPGEDPDWQGFIEGVVGKTDAPRKAQSEPLPPDRSQWVDGKLYQITDPSTGELIEAKYNEQRGGFEF